MAVQTVIAGCAGLNTILDPFQPVEGASYLSKAVNIRITDSGVIERSEPIRTLLSLINGHSLFCDGGSCLVHDGGTMYEVLTDLTLSTGKRTGMSGEAVDHTQAGDAIYFSNLQENGLYYGGIAIPWTVDRYEGSETNRYFEDHVPFFEHIAYFNGYMLGSIENALYASELGLLGCWEMKPVWMSNSRITMVKPVVTASFPVTGGIFVSDLSRISYLAGLDPLRLSEPRNTNYPALEWSVAHGYADGSKFGERPGLCAVFTTTRGKCLGYPDGTVINVTQKAITLPEGLTSGASLINGHNIISTLR